MPEAIVRPNGKTYRPKRAPRAEEFCTWDDAYAVVVIGTHDLEKARELAQGLWESVYYSEEPMPEGRPGWWRLVPWDPTGQFDRTWIDDPARGSAVVVFDPADVVP